MFNLFKAIGMGCSNYDTANGPPCELSDNITFAQVEREVSGGEFVACTASLECGTFSKLHNLPGSPPLRSVLGPERYGFKHESPADKDRVKLNNLISLRVAKFLGMLTDRRIPWTFEAPACHENQVSVLHLDEYLLLLSRSGFKHRKGVQCPFGALSSKPTPWVYFMADLEDMPST